MNCSATKSGRRQTTDVADHSDNGHDDRRLTFNGGPLWTGRVWSKVVGLLLTTGLTLYFVPALDAVFEETFGVRPITDTNSTP